jgi:hypothetical protein
MMRQGKAVRLSQVGLTVILVAAVLVGCGGESIPAPAEEGSEAAYTSDTLDTAYDGALSASNQLSLGTIQLEEADEQHPAENAVTPEQAAALLPLWQALQVKQIEGTMTQEQLEAIARLQLTQEDLQAWAQSQGLSMGVGPGRAGGGEALSPEERATRQAEFGGEEMPPEVATRRAEFENMSEEERAALRATREAGGGVPGGSGGRGGAGAGAGAGAGGRQFNFLLNPLIELLTERAAE